ncbi:MAG: hypothetical protein H6814_05780 [Phycisphaeraceae bacterium]|nr:hypothetical protein [Phycisphaeraceae bacterium]
MRRTFAVLGAVLAVGSFVSHAHAAVTTTDLVLSLGIGNDNWEWAPGRSPDAGDGGGWGYSGERSENHSSGGSWTLGWDIETSRNIVGENRGSQTAFVFNNLVLTNNTGATQIVTMTTTVPVIPGILPSSVMGGSASGTLSTNGDGGTMSNINNSDPMYRALIDGLAVGGIADLHLFDSSISVIGFGSNSTGFEDFGTPIPSAPGPAVNSTIGILLQFELTQGDSVSWTSSFVVNIPSPGAMGLLGMAGVVAIRRRR